MSKFVSSLSQKVQSGVLRMIFFATLSCIGLTEISVHSIGASEAASMDQLGVNKAMILHSFNANRSFKEPSFDGVSKNSGNEFRLASSGDSEAALEAKEKQFERLPTDVQDQILDDVAEAEESCRSKTLFSQFYDCGCIGERVFDARIKQGFEAGVANLITKMSDQCISEEKIFDSARTYFNSNYRSEISNHSEDEVDSVMRCFGERLARDYQEDPRPSVRHIARLRSIASAECIEENDFSQPPTSQAQSADSLLQSPSASIAGLSSDAQIIEQCAHDLRDLAQRIHGKPIEDKWVPFETGFDWFRNYLQDAEGTPEGVCYAAVTARAYTAFRSLLSEVHVQPVCAECKVKVYFHCADETEKGTAMLAGRTISAFSVGPGSVTDSPVGDTIIPFEAIVTETVRQFGGNLVADRTTQTDAFQELNMAKYDPNQKTGRFDDYCLVSVSE